MNTLVHSSHTEREDNLNEACELLNECIQKSTIVNSEVNEKTIGYMLNRSRSSSSSRSSSTNNNNRNCSSSFVLLVLSSLNITLFYYYSWIAMIDSLINR